MADRIFSSEQVADVTNLFGITDLENATIGQCAMIAQRLQEVTGVPFVRSEERRVGKEC